jgi:hypothetical protein
MEKGTLFTIVGSTTGDRSYQDYIFRVAEVCGQSIVTKVVYSDKSFCSMKIGKRFILNRELWIVNIVSQEFLDAALGGPVTSDEDSLDS